MAVFRVMGIKVIGIVTAVAAHSKINRQRFSGFNRVGLKWRSSGKVGVVLINDVIIALLVAFPRLCTIYLFRLLTSKLQVLVLLHSLIKLLFVKCNFSHILHLPIIIFPQRIYYPVRRGDWETKLNYYFLGKLCIHIFCSYDHKTCVNKAFLSLTLSFMSCV